NLGAEHSRDRHDDDEIEHQAELDKRRQSTRRGERCEIQAVLGDQKAECLEDRAAPHDGRGDSHSHETDRRALGAGMQEAKARHKRRDRQRDRERERQPGERVALAGDPPRLTRAKHNERQSERQQHGLREQDSAGDQQRGRLAARVVDRVHAKPHRLQRDERERNRPPTDHHHAERADHKGPGQRPGHDPPPANQLAKPRTHTAPPAPRNSGTRRMRIFACVVSHNASSAHHTGSDPASTATCATNGPGWGMNRSVASTSTIQWRAAAAHCRYASSRPASSSRGHSWTNVSSRCVSGLSPGWRPASASTTSPNASAAAQCAGSRHTAGRVAWALSASRSVLPPGRATSTSTSNNTASTATANVSSRLAPISPKPPAVSHAASVIAKRPSASNPTSTSASLPTGHPGDRPPIGRSTNAISSEPATVAGASSYTIVRGLGATPLLCHRRRSSR